MRPTATHLAARLRRFQEALRERRISLAVISNPKTFFYLTGHKPLLSVSPTRPWYLVVSATDALVACVPSIGLDDIRFDNPALAVTAWPSPDSQNEGLRLLCDTLAELARPGDVVGLELGQEMRVVMPIADLDVLRKERPDLHFIDAAEAIWDTRRIKDDTEVASMRAAIAAAHHAFKNIGPDLQPGVTECEAARAFQHLALDGGADSIGYLACSSGPGGYPSLTRAPTDRTLLANDVIGFDTGVIVDEMWCDFNRNYAIGTWPDDALRAQKALEAAIAHASQIIRPGVRTSAMRLAMEEIIQQHGFAPGIGGRWGHGVGLDFTEPPSLTRPDATPLTVGMVITLEPTITLVPSDSGNARILVHEEMFLVCGKKAECLT